MKTSLSVKTLLRTPLKTLLTILLLASTSFMLFFSVAEYAAVSREMDRAVDFYQGVGAVEVLPATQYTPEGFWPLNYPKENQFPVHGLDFYLYADKRVTFNPYGEEIRQNGYTGLMQSDIDAIKDLPYVTSSSVRYMTAGVSDTLWRADDRSDYYNYTARLIVEASLAHQRHIPPSYTQDDTIKSGYLPLNYFRMLTDDQQRYGREYSDKITIVYMTEFDRTSIVEMKGVRAGRSQRIFSTTHFGNYPFNDVFSNESLTGLEIGERYVFVGRMDYPTLAFSDAATLGSFEQIYPLKGQPDNYLELEEFAPLKELINLTNSDLHTLDVVYTDDMSSIMRFAEGNMTLISGRLLTPEDSENKNNVCVMSNSYMARNGLKIGDMIKLKLGDKLFEQNAALGAVAVVPERLADNFTEVEFEIVGIYKDVDTPIQQAKNLHWSYSSNTVFVPLPFLTAEIPADHEIKPGEMSITIDDPRNISAFLAEARPIIEGELGLTLIFTDGGWAKIETQITQAKVQASMKLLLISFAVVVAIILTAYLFITRKRKEYAIMRALGTSAKLSNRSLYVPLLVLGVLAPAVGTMLGYIYTGSRIEGVLAPLVEVGIEAETTIPIYLIPVCFACVLAALALATAFMLWRVSVKPPLVLLQAGANRNAGKEKAAVEAAVEIPVFTAYTSVRTSLPTEKSKPQSSVRHILRYVIRHIRRTPVKSMFSLGLALLLLGAIGQLTVIRGMYRDMYENLEQKAYIIKGINLKGALETAKLDFVESVYQETTVRSIKCEYELLEIVITNDIERYGGGSMEVIFLDGYDFSTQSVLGEPKLGDENRTCVINSALMKKLGVQLGDTVRFFNAAVQAYIINELYLIPTSDPELQREREEAVSPLLDSQSVYYTVVGEITSGGGENMVLTPASRGLGRVMSSSDNLMNYTEYTLTSPDNAEDFRAFANSRIVGTVGDIDSPLVVDTSEAENTLQTLNLIETLYPIAVAAAAIMGGLFPGLVVMQSDREAAIMRVLGTSKKRTRTILVIEQVTLCLFGQICAALLLLVINGILLLQHAAAIGIFGSSLLFACIAGALICAVIITRRRILEMLQVKE